jgi:hypothetical protein
MVNVGKLIRESGGVQAWAAFVFPGNSTVKSMKRVREYEEI